VSDEPIEGTATKTLAGKLHAVYKALGTVERTGENKSIDYKYATEDDIYRAVRPLFAEHGVLLFPEAESVSTADGTDTVLYTLQFIDVDTGESIAKRWPGSAKHDSFGNGLRGSATSAMRTFLSKAFQIPLGDDPEQDHGAPSSAHPFGDPYDEARRPIILAALQLLAGPGGDPIKLGGRITKRASGYMPAVVADTITILAGQVDQWNDVQQASEAASLPSEDPDGQGGEDPLPASPPEPSPTVDDGWGPDDG
jgi:hypothetical protein